MSGLLYHSAADIAAQALIDSGIGIAPDSSADDWQVRVDVMVDTPDNVITMKDNQGREHSRSMITGIVERSEGIQVTIRSRLSNVGKRKGLEIRNFFETGVYGMLVTIPAADGVPSATYRIHCFDTPGDVISVGFEDVSNRFIHTINSTMVVEMQ